MAKKVYRYIYDDLEIPSRSCILSTISQASSLTNIPYRTLQKTFMNHNYYFDKDGKFKIEKRVHHIATSKGRKKNV